MGITDSVFGTPGQTQVHQTPGTRDPGFGFAKKFFNSLGPVMNSPYPTYQGNLDPGMAPTLQDAIRRGQGYAQSGPSEILQGAQGSLGRFMSPNFQNPYNALFGGAANYGNADPNQRIYGGQPAGDMAFQQGMPGQGGGQAPSPGGDPQSAMMARNMSTGQSGGMVNGQWQPNNPGFGSSSGPYANPGGDPNAGKTLAQVAGGMPSSGPGSMASYLPGGGAPQPGTAAGMAPSVSSALNSMTGQGSGQPQTPDMTPTSSVPPDQPRQAPWGSGQNARAGFLDYMSNIPKEYRQKSPMDYWKDQQAKTPNATIMPPTGGSGTDWRAYWKQGRQLNGFKPGGGGPRDQGVAKPIPKKKPAYEILTAKG